MTIKNLVEKSFKQALLKLQESELSQQTDMDKNLMAQLMYSGSLEEKECWKYFFVEMTVLALGAKVNNVSLCADFLRGVLFYIAYTRIKEQLELEEMVKDPNV